jgi:hypothetical protein
VDRRVVDPSQQLDGLAARGASQQVAGTVVPGSIDGRGTGLAGHDKMTAAQRGGSAG